MRIAIVGQKHFGAEVLKMVTAFGHEVVAVCAPRNDRLEQAAAALGILPTSTLAAGLPEQPIDLIIAAHAHTFIGPQVRGRARFGCIGYHPSLLPLHRGRDAVRWTVHLRERVTGGTVYQMTDAVDGGPILAQEHIFVAPDDTAEGLWRVSLAPLGLKLLGHVVNHLRASDELPPARAQDESLATWEPSWERPPLSREPA